MKFPKAVAYWIILWCLPASIEAAPHIVGYERFHSSQPSKAGGAILYSELGCANCHGGSPVVTPRKGPTLQDLSTRVNYSWIIQFLKNPENGRKGSNMPSMLFGMQDQDFEAIAAVLSTNETGLSLLAPRHFNAELGATIYHENGCVACHGPDSNYLNESGLDSTTSYPLAVSLPDLRSKTSLVALEDFLTHTSRYRPDGRMPHFELGRDGAINVAAHLLGIEGSDPRTQKPVEKWPTANAEQLVRGMELVREASCAACHDLPGIAPPEIRPIGNEPSEDSHCLSTKPKEGLPFYGLTEYQRESLIKFLSEPQSITDINGNFTLKAMNCYACHDRGGLGGPTTETDPFFQGDESLGDSGRLPPPLTGIGHKLRIDWIEGVLTGDQTKRVRPYLNTLMPAYPNQVQKLAELMTRIDAKPHDRKLVDASGKSEDGRKLLGTQGGVNCITCHHWGEQKSIGIPGLDISELDKRLTPEWFRSYLLNPASYRPGTLMPSLWPDGQSTVSSILNGDSEKQISAIWEFIANGMGIPEGFPNLSGGKFELKPTTRPIIQRTFFTGVGTKAILVGFPGKIHIAYNGDSAQPGLVWRGDFFDAYSTWFMRMAPFENPLSNDVYSFPESAGIRRFRGYSLDKDGIPTFLFMESERLVKERFEVRHGQLIRSLMWEKGQAPEIVHPEGLLIEEKRKPQSLKIIYSWK